MVKKRTGHPKGTGPGEQIVVRAHGPLLEALDQWRAAQGDEPTRAEALRRLAERGLAAERESGAVIDLGEWNALADG